MTVKSIGIVGSGTMGSGIAEVAAAAGFEVTLRSRSLATAQAALQGVAEWIDGQVRKGKLSAEERGQLLGRIRPTDDLGDLASCDLVIESVVEDLETKKKLFAELDRICQPSAVLATNTSTLSVAEIAGATRRPDRVVGVHFFNPAPRMPLVEVVPASTTAPETAEEARRFVEGCGKQAVTAQDRAGFIVNALLFPYLNGAVRMLEHGRASRDDIDAAMRGACGFPMGPFELLDLVGIDVAVAVLEALNADDPADTCTEPAALLRRMVAEGHLGRKSGQGFHDYSDKR